MAHSLFSHIFWALIVLGENRFCSKYNTNRLSESINDMESVSIISGTIVFLRSYLVVETST